MSADARCKHCKNSLERISHFEVTRFDKKGEREGSVRVCSILCLMHWSYNYGVRRGVAGVLSVREAIARIGYALKGGG